MTLMTLVSQKSFLCVSLTEGHKKPSLQRVDSATKRPLWVKTNHLVRLRDWRPLEGKWNDFSELKTSFLCVSLSEGHKKPSLQRVDSATKRPLWGKTNHLVRLREW
jgi:hypothetical protein